ncbi:MAG: serine hydrolase domain-containing protein [Bacteroidia bacterium]
MGGLLFLGLGLHGQRLDKAWKANATALLRSDSLRPFNGKVLIAKGGKTLFSYESGHADMIAKTPFPKHGVFVIGSVTKQMTAVMVLQAVDQKLLDLHTPIRKYLHDIAQPWMDTVTIHHLLNHTSGYQGRDTSLAFAPGSRFSYSNQAYGLLGEILEAVRGKSFAAIAEELFQKSGMKHTTTPPKLVGQAMPKGYFHSETGEIQFSTNTTLGIPGPAGLVLSTPEDLVHWNQLLHIERSLLSAESYALMTSPSSKRNHPIFGEIDYGYGIQMTNVDGLRELSHGGYAPGFVTVNFFYPETGVSLIVMENLDWKDPAFKDSYSYEMALRKRLRAAFAPK